MLTGCPTAAGTVCLHHQLHVRLQPRPVRQVPSDCNAVHCDNTITHLEARTPLQGRSWLSAAADLHPPEMPWLPVCVMSLLRQVHLQAAYIAFCKSSPVNSLELNRRPLLAINACALWLEVCACVVAALLLQPNTKERVCSAFKKSSHVVHVCLSP